MKLLHPFMPFVTEEIYQMLPIKDSESIMISSYPEYKKEYVFENEYNKVEEKIEFIKNFRNCKAENNIPKDAKVLINTNDEIIIKMLKIGDYLVDEKQNINAYDIKTGSIEATIYYEKVMSEEDIKAREKQIETLKNSIERREKLLANENYVAKAPEAIVSKERNDLAREKAELEMLLNA